MEAWTHQFRVLEFLSLQFMIPSIYHVHRFNYKHLEVLAHL